MHKFRIILLTFAVLFCAMKTIRCQNIYFEGAYWGKKLIINNPASVDFFGTCISEVRVNGEIFPVNISSNYLEIDVSIVGVKKGDLFTITAEHDPGCIPFIYNKNDFVVETKIQFTNLKLEQNILSWEVKGNIILSPMLIEVRYREEWKSIAMVESKGLGNQSYSYNLPFVLSEKNSFRISKTNMSTPPVYFPEKTYPSQHFSISSNAPTKKIYLIKNDEPATTYFQLIDKNSIIVKEGYANQIDVTNLKSGIYTLYYDNQKQQIIKK